MKEGDVCLASQAVRHKSHNNLQSLLVLTYWWKHLLIDFVTKLPISTDWKGDNYNYILVIIDLLIKMIYYKPVKVIIDIPRLVKVILNVLVWHHSLRDSIMSNKNSLFTSKFWSLLWYFFDIKKQLSTIFHL